MNYNSFENNVTIRDKEEITHSRGKILESSDGGTRRQTKSIIFFFSHVFYFLVTQLKAIQ